MKTIISYLLLLFFNQQLLSQHTINQLQGRWVGTYGNDEKEAPYYFSFEFLPEGKMNVINNNDKLLATGTFSVIEDNIKIVYTYSDNVIQYACSGNLNTASNTLTGTWQRIADAGTNSAYTVTLNAPSRVILFCKTRTYRRSGILPLPVDYASKWRLEVWLNGTVSRTYNIEGLSRLGLAYTDNKLDLTTGPEYFDLPAGTHNFTFFATNLFGSSDVNMQVTSMIIPL